MIYILDTADINAIRRCNEYYPLAGVTTNPSIIAREGADFFELVSQIRDVIGEDKMLHVQTVEKTAEGILGEARLLRERIGGDLYIKVPVCEEGLKAVSLLKKEGIKVTVTAVFTPAQALMGAMAGADFVAPYVNRLDSILGDGVKVVEETVKLFSLYGVSTKVLAASFKNAEQVHKCALAGCHSVTVTDDILKNLISHPMTDAAIAGFDRDWSAVYGDKKITDL